MKYTLCLLLLVLSLCVVAKKPEIYRCAQKDGTVVIQDRRCMITDLQQVKSVRSNKVKGIRRSQTKRTLAEKNKPSTKPKKIIKSLSQVATQQNKLNSGRSTYFTLGWERFIPPNWEVKTSSISAYGDTMKTSQLDSFAQALELYHQIRDNNAFKLLDSQFKVHHSYKVFNIKYQNQRQQMLLTEFYIDERHNDLFVLTIQAPESNWQINKELAEQIISQL